MTETDEKDVAQRMDKSIQALQSELSRLRTGRASTVLLEHLRIECYGSEVPLSQLANLSVGDARTLVVNVWDKSLVPVIEKAILESRLGLNPVTSGEVIRVPLPALTEERRKEITKLVRSEGENARIAIRNVRRDCIHSVRERLKRKELTEDESHGLEAGIQKTTDACVARVDELVEVKEKEIMEV